ncbi:MAG: DUF368 domain-containing protein [Caldilineales bacterium]|nr:DUF368 domain-containing protein [Caldilineales bacterium]MDW8317526.1 DUF368 domain-containing protein [Anaerolineae bacterium]
MLDRNQTAFDDPSSVGNPTSLRDYALLAGRGFLMGSADVVPGVSGGTIAFITGIYQALIEAISAFNVAFVQRLLRLQLREAFAGVPWRFLLALGTGIAAAILTVSHGLSWALEHYPTLVWGFFFGLVSASILVVRRQVKRWTPALIATAVLFTVGMYLLAGLIPAELPHTPLILFLSGALASCAMILPGISGAFILVLVGQYPYVLQAVVDRRIGVLFLVAAGAALGLALASRALKWLFHHYHDVTVAALTGLMLGSLRKVWPWKVTTATQVTSTGEVIPLVQANVLPAGWSAEVAATIGLALLGFALVLAVEGLAQRVRSDRRTAVGPETPQVERA